MRKPAWGSGGDLPAPLYAKWTQTYNNDHPDVKVDYSAIGSGGGTGGITDKVVQFAGSDAPMTKEQEAKASGILHSPTVPRSMPAFVLLVITTLINGIARLMVMRVTGTKKR